MPKIVVSPLSVATFPDAGGHFWVHMQYFAGFSDLGCDVYWLEHLPSSGNPDLDSQLLRTFLDRMSEFGVAERVIVYRTGDNDSTVEYLNLEPTVADRILKESDLLLNFNYGINPEFLSTFRKSALVDIDPGLLQFWVSNNQLQMTDHDLYFSTGETVGTDRALFPDCGVPCVNIRPAIHLASWPSAFDANCEAFTTISSWWVEEYITDGKDILFENNKRAGFKPFEQLPSRTAQTLELALSFGDDESEERPRLEKQLWRIKHAREASSSPRLYQSYIQSSRGEFSCVKPSCIFFQNAWISDRSLCYLASGKPVVTQDTGPSSFLPSSEGLFRVGTVDEAVSALDLINSNYEQQCQAARALAEQHFDARDVAKSILNTAL